MTVHGQVSNRTDVRDVITVCVSAGSCDSRVRLECLVLCQLQRADILPVKGKSGLLIKNS